MSKTNFKFKIITESEKDMKLLEKAVSVDYKGKRESFVDTIPVLSSSEPLTAPKTASAFVKEFSELCDSTVSNVCMKISLGTLCDLKNSGVLVMNTNNEHSDNIQRNIVHDPNWISNLVADLLIGYQPIPSVTLSSVKDDDICFYATDGQQRLFAIIALLNNEFTFSGTKTCLDNKKFRDLPLEIKEILKSREIVALISKPEFSDFRKYSFIKLNTTATTLNSIEMANAMHSSEFSAVLKKAVRDSEHPHIAAMVTTVPSIKGACTDLVSDFSALPKTLKDRQTEYDRLLFAYANAKTDLDEVSSAKRAKRALQIYYLSKLEKKKVDVDAILREIARVSRLMYTLFGVASTREYLTRDNDDGTRSYERKSNGSYIHKGSVSNMQYNSLYFISNYLYNQGVRVSKISGKLQDESRNIIDSYFTSPEYVCMKGWNNNNSVYKANLAIAQRILELFKEAC